MIRLSQRFACALWQHAWEPRAVSHFVKSTPRSITYTTLLEQCTRPGCTARRESEFDGERELADFAVRRTAREVVDDKLRRKS